MKKIFVMLALTMGVVSANAQSVDSTAVTNTVAGDVTLTTDIYPQQEDGDIYHGLTKKLTFDRMIPPYGLEVTYDKGAMLFAGHRLPLRRRLLHPFDNRSTYSGMR